MIPLLAIALALSGPAAGGLSAEAARADACAYAEGSPRNITRRQARDATVCLINNRRASHGKDQLGTKSGLRKSAGRHSRRMRRGCFAHECPGEQGLVGRVHATSYLPCNCSWGIGENIATGRRKRGTPLGAVAAWMGSSSHRRTLLDGDFDHLGVGVAWRKHKAYYTADFGYKRG